MNFKRVLGIALVGALSTALGTTFVFGQNREVSARYREATNVEVSSKETRADQYEFIAQLTYDEEVDIYGEYLAVYEDTEDLYFAVVTSSTGLNLRYEPDMDAPVIRVLSRGVVVDIVEKGEKWHRVDSNGTYGYLYAEFVNVTNGERPGKYASEIIEFAMQHLGLRYSFGGIDLNRGVDCSGFVFSVFGNFDIQLGRSSRCQVNDGFRVERNEMLPGDIIFFDTMGSSNNGRISHAAIYIGDNQMIHAESGRVSAVTITSLSHQYWNPRFVAATRVL